MSDVIAAGKGKRSSSLRPCGNPECFVRDTDTKLKMCAQCKTQRYCSRECQTAHWPRHKDSCNANASITSALAALDAAGNTFGLPIGMTLVQLHEKVVKWTRFHSQLLMTAAIHALEIPRDLNRARTHLLYVQIRYRGDNNVSNGRAFEFVDATVLDLDSAVARGGRWPRAVEQIKEIQEERDRDRPAWRGVVAAAILECEPVDQLCSLGSLVEMDPTMIQMDWKELMRQYINAGKKIHGFVSPTPH